MDHTEADPLRSDSSGRLLRQPGPRLPRTPVDLADQWCSNADPRHPAEAAERLARELAENDRPIWSQLTFGAAEENFHAAARRGIEASLYWPRHGEIRAADLIRETLLPKAHAGLDRFGVDPYHRDRLLGIIDERCRTGRNGAVWQTETVWSAERTRGLDRDAALHDRLLRYNTLQRTNDPVHTWPVE